MPPRGQGGRRKISKGHVSGKMPTKSSSPSVTLQEILDTLSITYNPELGTLEGEGTSELPSITTLEQLRKLFVKLNDQLEIVLNHDELTIVEIKRQLRKSAQDIDDDSIMTDATPITTEATPQPDDEGDSSNNKQGEAEEEEEEVGEGERERIKESRGGTEEEKQEGQSTQKVESDDEDSQNEKDEFTDAKDQIEVEENTQSVADEEREDLIENDPSVRNPKSEFVKAQTLPAAAQALGLFTEKDGGLEEHGEDYLKEKYAVASYPSNDLKGKLPGTIPDIDFSKNKPANQVQFTTFQSFIENFYRNFSDDDLKFLKTKHISPEFLMNDSTYDPNLTPFLIPNLGPLYSTVWNEEDNAGSYSPPPNSVSLDSIIPKKSAEDLSDEALETEQVSCGPLVSRLLSAIIRDDKSTEENRDSTNDDNDTSSKQSISSIPDQQGWKVSSVNTDYNTLEERLKRELKYIGIFMNLTSNGDYENKRSNSVTNEDDDQEIDWLNPQDDELSAELRQLQGELEQVSKRNNKRKKILLPVIENQLAWQEYLSILDDLDKQVDQAYLKRIRVPKNKKRKTIPNVSTNQTSSSLPPSIQAQVAAQHAHQQAANSAVKSLMEKRVRWISKIGPLFEKENGQNMKRLPTESIFKRLEDEEDDDDDYEDGAEDLVLQEQH